MSRLVDSPLEREAQRVYDELGLGTAEQREALLRELGVQAVSEEAAPKGCEIRTSPNSDLRSESENAHLERTP